MHTVEMIGGRDDVDAAELRRLLQHRAGLDLARLGPARGGESRRAFWVTDHAGRAGLLKIIPGAGPEAAGRLRALDAVLGRLRARGYPAPEFRTIGSVPGLVFWIQQRLPGHVPAPGTGGPPVAASLLPRLLELNDAQESMGAGPGGTWRRVIILR